MGFWKEVLYDVQRGVPTERAVHLNAQIKYGNKEEKQKAQAILEAEVVLNKMK